MAVQLDAMRIRQHHFDAARAYVDSHQVRFVHIHSNIAYLQLPAPANAGAGL